MKSKIKVIYPLHNFPIEELLSVCNSDQEEMKHDAILILSERLKNLDIDKYLSDLKYKIEKFLTTQKEKETYKGRVIHKREDLNTLSLIELDSYAKYGDDIVFRMIAKELLEEFDNWKKQKLEEQ